MLEILRLFRNIPDIIFGTVLGQSGHNFRDNFWTVRAEFFGLFLDSLDRIFETVFEQSRIEFWTLCVLFFYVLLQNKMNSMLVV